MIHLIGAIDDLAAAMRGIDGFVALNVDDTVYVGVPALTAPVPDTTSLCNYDAWVNRFMEVCTVAPFRFGTVVSGAGDLSERLEGAGAQMAAMLRRLRGRREMGLRAALRPDATANDPGGHTAAHLGSGTGYLRRLSEAAHLPDELSGLHEQLSSIAIDAVGEWDTPQGLFKGAYLVDAPDVGGFSDFAIRSAVDRAAVSSASLTGPWAPYSFVRLPDRNHV